MVNTKPTQASEIETMYAEEKSTSPASAPSMAFPRKKSKGPKVFLTLVLIIILVLVVLLIVSKTTNWDVLGLANKNIPLISKPGGGGASDVVKASDWQAIFLTNGQVYFGHLKNAKDMYPTLEDIYYLQVQNVPIQPAQPATEEEGVQPAQETEEQLILVKFGTELHRPMDKMYINKDHILMFEDLANNSNVVAAIENYKAQQAAK